MQEVQDAFFSERYMAPALGKFQEFGFSHPLSAAAIYDSYIHSGGLNMQARTEKTYGAPSAANEKEWIAGYTKTRKEWLSTHSNPLLHATAIRLETFQRQMREGNWSLDMPLHVVRPAKTYPLTPYDLAEHLYRNNPVRRLAKEIFGVAAPKAASGANGRDRFIQSALAKLGFLSGTADGVYGTATATAVKAFRKKYGLAPESSGNVDGEAYDKLCDCLEEMGRTGQVNAKPADALKPLPPEEKKLTTGAGAAGTAVVGAGAGAGAVALGAGEGLENAELADPTTGAGAAPTASPVETVTLPVEQQAATTPAAAVVDADVETVAPVVSADIAEPAASEAATDAGVSTPAAPATPPVSAADNPGSPWLGTAMGASSEDVMFQAFGNDVTKGELVTVGACSLFVAAVALFAVSRRTAEMGGK
jgi:peptidoglycan hydrolase-like protein with peptidoglycan-binding domain